MTAVLLFAVRRMLQEKEIDLVNQEDRSSVSQDVRDPILRP
jgi:hypothetical protein